MPEHVAHSPATDGGPFQPLFEDRGGVRAHARAVATGAAAFAEAFESGRVAEWLGWWHDAGKVAPDVQEYLRGETDTARGPDHSSAGTLAAAELGPLFPLAFNVAGHHGGLPDLDALKSRIERKRAEGRVTEALDVAKSILARLAPEVGIADVPAFAQRGKHAAELWVRMLHSALVDADRLDAEAFGSPDRAALRDGVDLTDLGATLADRLEASQEALIRQSEGTGDVNDARAEVYRACLRAADGPQGTYTLTVPTGGGKTRSVMAFALRHAARHGLRRAIVALPYTSIIDQNADVYRSLLGGEHVLEHHSAVASGESDPPTDAERRRQLAAENWDAPVVVTTTVQLLESLFANANSRVRKLHRLARSVVVLDEVQTLPPRLLAPTLDVLQALVRDYGVTIVLCTATPPALSTREHFSGLDDVRHIIAPEAQSVLFDRLRRVDYRVDLAEPWGWPRVALEATAQPRSLTVLNTKKDALAVLGALPEDASPLHLSTLLCGAHRRAVLDEVHRRLATGDPCHLVATQVVEAGVDLDFALVLRALGPLDRIVQAAGRCNREGRLTDAGGRARRGEVVVFRPRDGGLPPGAYAAGSQEAETMLREAGDFAQRDLHDPATALAFFRRLYSLIGGDGGRGLDKNDVQGLRKRLHFAETARAYRLIDDESVPVVVDYRGDAAAVARRDAALKRAQRNGYATRADFRALQPFTVTLREHAHEKAVAQSACVEVAPGLWRWTGDYDGGHDGRCGRGLRSGIPLLTNRADGGVI